MTPELKTACEVVFQEHKTSHQPIKWNKDAFRGQISIGLSELAKKTLVDKNIIVLPNKSKKIITLLNPAVADAASFEEAEKIIKNKRLVLANHIPDEQPVYISQHISEVRIPGPSYSRDLLSIAGVAEAPLTGELKWYLKPLFYYVVWPICAAVTGALATFLIDFTYTRLFLDWK